MTLLPGDPRHGLGGYNNHHCRCAICTSANTAYQAAYKRRPAQTSILEAAHIAYLADIIGESRDWMARAACKGTDPNLFHPERGADVKDAKAVCGECPVADECLAYAIANCEQHGLWGGRSERQRRSIRSKVLMLNRSRERVA